MLKEQLLFLNVFFNRLYECKVFFDTDEVGKLRKIKEDIYAKGMGEYVQNVV